MTVLDLSKHKTLFASDEALREFVQILHESIDKSGTSIVLDEKGNVVGAALSSDVMKQILSERILRRLLKAPDLVAKIHHRLEHDEIVD